MSHTDILILKYNDDAFKLLLRIENTFYFIICIEMVVANSFFSYLEQSPYKKHYIENHSNYKCLTVIEYRTKKLKTYSHTTCMKKYKLKTNKRTTIFCIMT